MKQTRKPKGSLPGLHGVEHIGLTVPDVEKATDFFVDTLGCEAFYYLGPYRADDDWMAVHVNVHPRTVVNKIRFLRCGNGANFELVEMEAPDQQVVRPKNSDIGGHHLAFYVDDIDAAVEYLKNQGVEALGTPTVRTEGPHGGQTWVYFLAPWGLQLELVSYPDGKAYERDYQERLWHPKHPADRPQRSQ